MVSAIEHKSVLAAASILKDRFGYQVERLPVDSEGRVTVRALEDALDDTVLAVTIMTVNNEIVACRFSLTQWVQSFIPMRRKRP